MTMLENRIPALFTKSYLLISNSVEMKRLVLLFHQGRAPEVFVVKSNRTKVASTLLLLISKLPEHVGYNCNIYEDDHVL